MIDEKGINKIIYESLHNSQLNYETLIGAHNFQEKLEDFLIKSKKPSLSKAKDLIRSLWEQYRKIDYDSLLQELERTELGIQVLRNEHRDHVIHSAYVFILGVYFYLNDPLIRGSFRHTIDSNNGERDNQDSNKRRRSDDEEFIFQWLLTSTFHDLAYPYEIFSSFLKGNSEKINTIIKDNNKTNFVTLKPILKEIDNLSNERNSFDILNNTLHNSAKNHNINTINIKDYYSSNIDRGIMDHGILSALLFLRITDALYEKNHWSTDYFNATMSKISLAMALHNIPFHRPLDNIDDQSRSNSRPNLFYNPLGYLLILCDTLQEWNRSLSGHRNISPEKIEIYYLNNEQRWDIQMNLNKAGVKKIQNELDNKIDHSDGIQYKFN